MYKAKGVTHPFSWRIFRKNAAVLILTITLAGCGADRQWVKDYVGQELEPMRQGQDRVKPLEVSLTGTRAEVELLRERVASIEETRARDETPESLEQVMAENAEELLWLQEDIDEMDARLADVEYAVRTLAGDRGVGEIVPETAPGPVLQPAQKEAGPPGVEPQASQPIDGDLLTLSREVEKLRAIISDVSRLVGHVDRQYQQYHKEVGGLSVDLTNDMDTLEKRMGALENRMSGLEDAQRAVLAEITELPQKDVELLEERLRELIEELPK